MLEDTGLRKSWFSQPRFWVAIVVVLQLGVLVYMAGFREFIRSTGDVVYFRTAPIDPHDPLRGDYVRLNYDISSLPTALWLQYQPPHEDDTKKDSRRPHRDEQLYVSFSTDENNIAQFKNLHIDEPTSGLFIKGYVGNSRTWLQPPQFSMRYGIEQFFVEQGKGLEIEDRQGRRGSLQIPLEVEVAISAGGTAVTRDYRWSKVGIETDIVFEDNEERQLATDDQPSRSPQVNITLHNVSDSALAFYNNAANCSFSLGHAELGVMVKPASSECTNYLPSKDDEIILQPNEHFSVLLDLNEERWHLLDEEGLIEEGLLDGASKAIHELNLRDRYRITYHSPTNSDNLIKTAGTPIWRGQISSRAFQPGGRID